MMTKSRILWTPLAVVALLIGTGARISAQTPSSDDRATVAVLIEEVRALRAELARLADGRLSADSMVARLQVQERREAPPRDALSRVAYFGSLRRAGILDVEGRLHGRPLY
jgi:hypothetical protein